MDSSHITFGSPSATSVQGPHHDCSPHDGPSSSTIPSSSSPPLSPCSSGFRTAPPSPPSLHKDEDMYFHDGNVMLITGTTCFRVHQSLLAKHSSVFCDLFNIPQPNNQDLYEGVPRVDLQDDPDVVRALLRMIYEPFSSPIKGWLTQPSPQSTIEMVGVLSLALKYEIDALRTEIANQLSLAWPRTIEEWDTLAKKREMFSDVPHLDPAATIRMARIADMPEVLPLAYYCLIQGYPKRMIYSGSGAVSGEGTCMEGVGPMTHLLDREDLAALALGREEMAKWVSQHAKGKFRTWNCPSSTSQRGLVCSQRIHLRWAEVLEDVTMRRDILEILKEHAGWGTGTFGMILCSACQSAYVEIMRQMRKDFFRDLPRIFGLGSSSACHLSTHIN